MFLKNGNCLSKQKGFTLVEALLVIAFIGVIAAVTITTLTMNSTKSKYISTLQKANATLTDIVNVSQSRGTFMSSWDFTVSSQDFAERYIIENLNVAANCGTNSGGICFGQNYKYKDDTAVEQDYNSDTNYYKVILVDEISIGIKTNPDCSIDAGSECVSFLVDTNGPKGPNKWGYDVFEFVIYPQLTAILPSGTFTGFDGTNWIMQEADAVNTNCLSGNGKYCALKIINDGWEMKY